MTLALRVSDVTKRFGQNIAIADLSFEVATGEVFGLLGPNGAGKTTTLRMLAGLYTPDEGQIEVAGLRVGEHSDAVRSKVGLLTEQPGLYDRLTTEENLAFFASLYGLSAQQTAPRSEHWLRLLGLWEHRDKRAGTLSKGMRQKLAIARAVIHEPPLVLLDEPTSGLDPEAARTVRDAIANLATSGRTLVLCSHNLFEVEQLCRRVAILRPSPHGGRLVALTEVSKLRVGAMGVTIELETDPALWLALARDVQGVAEVEASQRSLEVLFAPGPSPIPALVAALAGAGARIVAVQPRARAFEEAYLSLMAERGAA